MIIGIPKEIKAQEHRVGLLPSLVYQLCQRGHEILVERGAGEGSGYVDAEYTKAGAEVVIKHEEIFERSEMIVKVKEPLPEEYGLLRAEQILFTYLHLAASRSLTERLLRSGVTAIAYETVEVHRRLPLLEPMSEIAGRMSIIMGGYFLAKQNGGKGVLLGGVPGVLPGKEIVIGGGTAGVNAARMATGLGADVTILEVDVEAAAGGAKATDDGRGGVRLEARGNFAETKFARMQNEFLRERAVSIAKEIGQRTRLIGG